MTKKEDRAFRKHMFERFCRPPTAEEQAHIDMIEEFTWKKMQEAWRRSKGKLRILPPVEITNAELDAPVPCKATKRRDKRRK